MSQTPTDPQRRPLTTMTTTMMQFEILAALALAPAPEASGGGHRHLMIRQVHPVTEM